MSNSTNSKVSDRLSTDIKMTRDLSVFNDIDSLYSKEPIEQTDGSFQCPVCMKKYKSIKGVNKHMEKRDCFSYLALLKDTMMELSCYQLYKLLMAEEESNRLITVSSFRKSSYYKNIAKFMIFCKLHEVKNINSYLRFINHKGFNSAQGILKGGIKESVLRDYRFYQQLNAKDEIDSAEFLDRYEKDLLTDDNFMVRSLEKSHIGLVYLLFGQDRIDFDSRVQNLPIDYQERVFELADRILSELDSK